MKLLLCLKQQANAYKCSDVPGIANVRFTFSSVFAINIPCYDAEIIQEMVKETGFTPDYVKEAGEYTPGSFLSSAFSNRLFGPTNEDILWEHQYKVITSLY